MDRLSSGPLSVYILSEKSLAQRSGALAGVQLRHVKLHHRVGQRVSEVKLRGMPLSEATCILIVAQGPASPSPEAAESDDAHQLIEGVKDECSEDSMNSDSICLSVLVLVNRILGLNIRSNPEAGKVRISVRDDDDEDAEPGRSTVICEILDARTDRILGRNAALKSLGQFFRSKAVEAGLFNKAMSDTLVFHTIMQMLFSDEVGMRSLPAAAVLPGIGGSDDGLDSDLGCFSFREIDDEITRQGMGILCGYKRNRHVDLAPKEPRDQKLRWRAGHFLLVLARK